MVAGRSSCFISACIKVHGKNVVLQALRVYHCDGKIRKSRVIIPKMESHRKLEVQALERGMTSVYMALLWLKDIFGITILNLVLLTPQQQYEPLFALDQQLNIFDRKCFAPGKVTSDFYSTMNWKSGFPVMD